MALVEESQFEGCLVGVLVGDCVGFTFENELSHSYSAQKIQTYFDNFFEPEEEDEENIQHTDDTSMTKSVLNSLVNCDRFDVQDIAKRFTEAYYSEEKGVSYESHVFEVFQDLRATNYEDVSKAASEQFNGTGSLGNGGGMRVAPLALYTINETDLTNLVAMTVQTTRITHTHPKGIVGAIFQALAVRHGLLFGQKRKEESTVVDPIQILEAFEKDFEFLAKGNVALPSDIPSFESGYADYLAKLKVIRKLLVDGNEKLEVPSVKSALGVAITAAESIPTAFFCFLAAFKDIPFVKADTQFQRTIQLAVCLGGDTDTIASMAGAIAGGFLGRSEIPDQLARVCEDFELVTDLSRKLYAKTLTVS